MYKLNKVSDEALSRFMSLDRLVQTLTSFWANVTKFKLCPIMAQVDYKKLEDLYGKIKALLSLELINPT